MRSILKSIALAALIAIIRIDAMDERNPRAQALLKEIVKTAQDIQNQCKQLVAFEGPVLVLESLVNRLGEASVELDDVISVQTRSAARQAAAMAAALESQSANASSSSIPSREEPNKRRKKDTL
jgi:hypothetical protein